MVTDSDCCDSCPFWPTCEETRDFERTALELDDDEGNAP